MKFDMKSEVRSDECRLWIDGKPFADSRGRIVCRLEMTRSKKCGEFGAIYFEWNKEVLSIIDSLKARSADFKFEWSDGETLELVNIRIGCSYHGLVKGESHVIFRTEKAHKDLYGENA